MLTKDADDLDVILNDLPPNTEIIDLGYRPRPFQKVIHYNLRRFNVIVCHRRFGKTVFAIGEMVDAGLNNERHNPQYAYIAPTYGQAKRVAWEYLKDFCKNIPGAKANEADLRIDIPRPHKGDKIRFMLLGAENPDSLRGIYLDGVVLDEYAQCDPIIWGQVIRPALSDRKGWAVFIGTPKGKNHFYDLYYTALELAKTSKSWFVAMYKASQTGVVDEEELREAKMAMSEEEYEQEYECSFSAALVGAYYGKYIAELEKEDKITNFRIDPTVACSTYWDLGINDTTSIWIIQQLGNEIRVVDYIENGGVGLEYYAKVLGDKPYIYDRHVLPHDGAARELGTGRSRQETLLDLGIRTEIQARQSISDGINACRILLQKNIFFHADNTKRGIECLKNYQRKYDSKNQLYLDAPLHNWASNGADAFRTAGLGLQLPENKLNISEYAQINISEWNELGD